MTHRTRRRHQHTAFVLLACAAAAASAAQDDAGALGLESDEPVQRTAAKTPTTLYIEAAPGFVDQRYGLGNRFRGRVSADLRTSVELAESVRGVVSARVDVLDPHEPQLDGHAVTSFREGYVGWQNAASNHLVEIGRINVRQGPGYGYNPTDFFRDNTLRTLTTADPFQLRENRLGSVMLRAQRLWSGGSVELIYAPDLEQRRSREAVSFDLGATNSRDRGMAVLNTRWSEAVNSQLTLYRESGTPWRLGVAGTALLLKSLVAHGEATTSREEDLLPRALGQPTPHSTGQRAVAGLTYTTPSLLSMTIEYQYNGFAMGRDGFQFIQQGGPPVWSAYYLQALALQDNAARHTAFLYAAQRDVGLKSLDLTLILRANLVDKSRMAWLELKYHLASVDLALQVQHSGGKQGSESGSAINRNLVNLVATLYF